MSILKITGVLLVIFIIFLSATFVYNKTNQPAPDPDPNYNQKAIYFFLVNSESFEQVKDYLLALNEDISIQWKDENLDAWDRNYNKVKIDGELKESLVQLFSLNDSMIIYYKAENTKINFLLVDGGYPKGIVYMGIDNEKEINAILHYPTLLKIRDHWYYYEDIPMQGL